LSLSAYAADARSLLGGVQREQRTVAAQTAGRRHRQNPKIDDSLLKSFLAISKDVVAEIGSGDELSKKIYASYQQFRTSIMD
jgi:TRAP-type mannitol/chloroaromatic compound transport system substrate-binding protein